MSMIVNSQMKITRTSREAFRRPVTSATALLAAICFLDTFYTLWAVRMGIAREVNPLLNYFLAKSDAHFLIVKGLSFLGPLTALELLRPLSPQFIPAALKVGTLAYLAIYGFGSLLVS